MAPLGWKGRGGGKPRLLALGDSAVLAEFSDTVDMAVNARIQQVAARVREQAPAWVRDVVPSMAAIAVHFDAEAVAAAGLDTADARIAAARAALQALVERCAEAVPKAEGLPEAAIEVPVCYGGAFGEDLEAVATQLKMRPEEVVRRHCASEHRVLMVGFAPGHPYIGGLDPALSVPRRATPRVRVPEGSIAIANGQSVVYPFTISGGWSIIGRTPLRVFDAAASPPAIFSPGQRVRFVAIDEADYARRRSRAGRA